MKLIEVSCGPESPQSTRVLSEGSEEDILATYAELREKGDSQDGRPTGLVVLNNDGSVRYACS